MPAPIILRLAPGYPQQHDKLHLLVFLDRSLEEFQVPVGSARHVEDAVGAFAAIDDDGPFIIGERCL